jgi:AbrB family looped-hinge helix DNA binding protein
VPGRFLGWSTSRLPPRTAHKKEGEIARHLDQAKMKTKILRTTGITCQEFKMRVNSKGQVTIPAHLRERHGFHEGDEVDVIEDGGTLRIVRAEASLTRGQRLAARMRGRATTTMSTDQLLELLRGE